MISGKPISEWYTHQKWRNRKSNRAPTAPQLSRDIFILSPEMSEAMLSKRTVSAGGDGLSQHQYPLQISCFSALRLLARTWHWGMCGMMCEKNLLPNPAVVECSTILFAPEIRFGLCTNSFQKAGHISLHASSTNIWPLCLRMWLLKACSHFAVQFSSPTNSEDLWKAMHLNFLIILMCWNM